MSTAVKKPAVKKPAPTPAEDPFASWPKKGASRESAQPHDVEDHGVEDFAGHVPVLTSGSADLAVVVDLGRRLQSLGFDNSAARGENPFGLVDQSVLAAVNAFRRAYGVREPVGNFIDQADADAHVGPWTATAIIRASDRL